MNKLELLEIRRNAHGLVRLAKDFSKNPLNLDSEALSILGLDNTKRSVFHITDREIIENIKDIQKKLGAVRHVVSGILCDIEDIESEEGKEQARHIMYGKDRISSYTGEQLEDFDLWNEMVNGTPSKAASYQAQNFG